MLELSFEIDAFYMYLGITFQLAKNKDETCFKLHFHSCSQRLHSCRLQGAALLSECGKKFSNNHVRYCDVTSLACQASALRASDSETFCLPSGTQQTYKHSILLSTHLSLRRDTTTIIHSATQLPPTMHYNGITVRILNAKDEPFVEYKDTDDFPDSEQLTQALIELPGPNEGQEFGFAYAVNPDNR